jgi:hypothetical protein
MSALLSERAVFLNGRSTPLPATPDDGGLFDAA